MKIDQEISLAIIPCYLHGFNCGQDLENRVVNSKFLRAKCKAWMGYPFVNVPFVDENFRSIHELHRDQPTTQIVCPDADD